MIVGEHLRDWLVIHRVIDEINHRGLDVEFHVVTDERIFPYFNGCANLVYHSQISETELIDLYRSADVLFLPVTNATANNSILEALACGTPVISTLVGGIPDYVNDECGWLLPVGDVVGHVNLIASLHGNRELARRRRQAARTQALKFDWRSSCGADGRSICRRQVPATVVSRQAARLKRNSSQHTSEDQLYKTWTKRVVGISRDFLRIHVRYDQCCVRSH